MRLSFLRIAAVVATVMPLAACSLWEDEPPAPLPPPPVGVTPGQPGITGPVTAPAPQTPARAPSQSISQSAGQLPNQPGTQTPAASVGQDTSQPSLQTAPVGAVTTGEIPQSTDPRNFAPPYPVRMAFIWYDVPGMGGQDFFETRVQLRAEGNSTWMSFPLAYLGIGCEGLIQYDSGTNPSLIGGDFRINCNDGSSIQGVIVPVVGQPAINGQGVDQYGRSVIFAIQMDED